jgi:hypothetical protein
MADYAELQERLRATTKEMAARASVDMALWDKHSNACIKAADAIAALRRERDEAMQIVAVIHRDGGHRSGQIGNTAAIEEAHVKWGETVARIDALEAENARMREALDFYALPSDYVAPFTGGMGKLWKDCGETARAALGASHEG